ncbi:hypothetical protein JOD82_002249 [Paenibacillus sp. 1182]|uniref:hypothetical protein n=1 Tax=Paenibacillus sp. 1182 TaxID=2806565 RepID=UPI001AE49B02|nr:hypothetical protein [Paenibacillus sp. 1182]MBP1309229.1 hypothetical protein [Paenibacillus sp. 1182]
MNKHDYYEKRAEAFDINKHFDILQTLLKEDLVAKELILRWKEVILSLISKEGYPPPMDITHEIYSLVVGYDSGSFEYRFNIDLANTLLPAMNKLAVELPVREAIKYVDIDNLSIKRAVKNHNNPILIMKSQLFDQPQCINGNHRIFSAYEKGQETITLYYIEDNECIPFLSTRIGRAMYMMNTDLNNTLHLPGKLDTNSLLIERADEWLFINKGSR